MMVWMPYGAGLSYTRAYLETEIGVSSDRFVRDVSNGLSDAVYVALSTNEQVRITVQRISTHKNWQQVGAERRDNFVGSDTMGLALRELLRPLAGSHGFWGMTFDGPVLGSFDREEPVPEFIIEWGRDAWMELFTE